MSKRLCTLVLAVVGALGFSTAHALDDATIDQWLGSMSELQQLAATEGDLEEDFESPDSMADMDFEAMMAESAREHEQIQSVIRKHGYSDEDEWAHVGGRIFRAMMASEMQMTPEREQEMQNALQEIDQHPHLSDEQKGRMRQQIEQQMEAFTGLFEDVPEGDMRAVQRRREAIMEVMDED